MANTTAGTLQWQRLQRWRGDELATLFTTLDPGPAPAGRLRGRLLAIRGTDALPGPLKGALYSVLGLALNPWRGKYFAADHGSNVWGCLNGPRFGHYSTRLCEGADGEPSLWLDYNLPGNPALLRAIRGEARQLHNGSWLCCMHWQGQQLHRAILWFTLEGTAHER